MISPIGPGDVVECVDARPLSDGSACPLVVGRHYIVAVVWPPMPHNGAAGADWWDCGLELREEPRPFGHPHLVWGLYRFKPLGQRFHKGGLALALEDA